MIRLEFCRSLLEIVTSIFRHYYQTQSKFDVTFIFFPPFSGPHTARLAHIVYRTVAMLHARMSGRGF